MRLVIEYIGTGPRKLPLISVAHYGEQNGDAMRDPDMTFEVADDSITGRWRWLPVTFRDDYAGIDQEAIFTDETGRVLIRPRLVTELVAFSRTWDRNIKAQGFADAVVTLERVP